MQINNYGQRLQRKVASYPDRIKQVQDMARKLNLTTISLDENEAHIYARLREFNRELKNLKIMVQTIIRTYKKLQDEVKEDYAALQAKIVDAPEGTSDERLDSLRISSNQLLQYEATIQVQIGLFDSYLQTIDRSKSAISEAMMQQRVASLLPALEELSKQSQAIKKGGEA